jgi:PAT family beta-lactamase induction signal transducer AmpG
MDIEYRNDTREIGIICSACIIYSFLLEKILMIKKEEKISNLFKYYFDIRMIRILLLGAISGFPWVLIGSSLSLWLKEEGLSRSTIGWAGLIFGVYAFNYLWAPLIDRIQIPFLTKKIGHRRGWIVLMQLVILISLVLWSLINPSENLALLISIGLVIAIASSTQDITVDALRIEQVGENETKSMAAGAAMAVVGWWTGYKLGGVIALFTAEYFENIGVNNYWQATFLVMGVVVILMNIALMFVHENSNTERILSQKKTDEIIKNKFGNNNFLTKILSWLSGTIGGPVISFFKKNGFSIAIGILGFVFLFKIGEAFLGRMSIVFYKELGFSKSDIAIYSKTLGWITTVVFTLLGGLFAIRSGTVKTMFIAGGLMAVTNLMFTLLAWSGKSELLFATAVILDDIAAAFATVAFVAFISLLVDRTYTATQYALLASIGTAGRTLLASSSGSLVDWLNGDWGIFFIITALMVIPSLICLWFIRKKLKLSEK